MYRMILAPDSDGYSATDGNDMVSTAAGGGFGRSRQDQIGVPNSVNLKWTLNQSQYAYWRAFFNLTRHGQVFLCPLVSEDGNGPQDYECKFVPGSVTLPSQYGLTYVQQAQLEVKPLVRDTQADMALLVAFEAADGQFDSWYLALERLANVTIPNAGRI